MSKNKDESDYQKLISDFNDGVSYLVEIVSQSTDEIREDVSRGVKRFFKNFSDGFNFGQDKQGK